jgi:hypothetical protein
LLKIQAYSLQGEKMDNNVDAGLIIVGVLVGLLAVAFIAQATGLTNNYVNMPYGQMMSGNGMMGGGMVRMMAGGALPVA